MALTKCKECKKEVSDKAKTCPHCGVKDPGTKPVPVAGCLVLVLLAIFGVYFISSDDDKSTTTHITPEDISKPKAQKTPEQIAAEDKAREEAKIAAQKKAALEEAACKKDLGCWGDKHRVAATFKCDDQVEKLAQFSHEWTDGFLDLKFSHYRWKDVNKGIVTYIGDKIKFQNAFGAWQNAIYECDYDTINESVLDVRAEAGRL